MTTSRLIFAILWNIFVIPGAGQIYLKHKRRGWIFAGLALLLLLAFLIHFAVVVQQHLKTLELRPEDISNLWQFSQNIGQDILQKQWGLIKAYGSLLIFCYLSSLVDIFYLRGRKPA